MSGEFTRIGQAKPASIQAVMKAKASTLDSQTRTIRNALRSASRNQATRWVGHNYRGFFIVCDPTEGGAGVTHECTPTGEVWAIDPPQA